MFFLLPAFKASFGIQGDIDYGNNQRAGFLALLILLGRNEYFKPTANLSVKSAENCLLLLPGVFV
jgi:hypothetical protein